MSFLKKIKNTAAAKKSKDPAFVRLIFGDRKQLVFSFSSEKEAAKFQEAAGKVLGPGATDFGTQTDGFLDHAVDGSDKIIPISLRQG